MRYTYKISLSNFENSLRNEIKEHIYLLTLDIGCKSWFISVNIFLLLRYVGLPLQWEGIVSNALDRGNRPQPLVDPRHITPVEVNT